MTLANSSIEKSVQTITKELKKNSKRFEDDFFSGEPDILYKDSVIDIKTCETKASFDAKTLKMAIDDYFWQLYGYKRLIKDEQNYNVEITKGD